MSTLKSDLQSSKDFRYECAKRIEAKIPRTSLFITLSTTGNPRRNYTAGSTGMPGGHWLPWLGKASKGPTQESKYRGQSSQAPPPQVRGRPLRLGQ
ncbi:hypothetical protein FSPOR_4229 [Fusarium sporotrichioides]|uniref:Uncharacterized protein n=1 Tax=Fusarium sporotrichioides TaxID=5514 RepID=A0A395SD73_FUSSP|nr:hypothetical protein FSPOR_4229 [Fusarium sporotrichioides]